ncbi:hypothetical protein H4R18_003636 [Coemansia javaensis]|uniref:Tetraspanin n=1 Tax=Coemansia javaensis TaxID=2761396 RepID=A0A9W8HBK0_9FUNG|nr:hypothetical protein H4R18_003636 [Coemansia javaensis]
MLSMNAAMLRIGYDLGNNMAAALLAATAACGALTGACFSAFGVESMTSMVAGFSRPGIPMCIVVLGLGALYVSGVAAAGAVNCSPAYVRNVGWAALAVVLGEVLVLVAAAQDPLATAREHEDAWRRIHSVNPLSLQRIEHAFGCCGFQDHTDMPSHPGCAREAAVDGCASHLARAAFRVSRSTLRWCSAVLITQLLLLVAGGFLVGRVHEASGAWLRGVLRGLHMGLSAAAAVPALFLACVGMVDLFGLHAWFSGMTVPALLVAAGVAVSGVALLGVAGSAKRSQHLCGMYSGLAALLVGAQALGLVIMWLWPIDPEHDFYDTWRIMYDADRVTIRRIENTLQCCGFRSPVDMPVPKHCAVKTGFTTGCLTPLATAWEWRRHAVLVAGTVAVAAQLVALLVGVEMARRYKRQRLGYQQIPAVE